MGLLYFTYFTLLADCLLAAVDFVNKTSLFWVCMCMCVCIIITFCIMIRSLWTCNTVAIKTYNAHKIAKTYPAETLFMTLFISTAVNKTSFKLSTNYFWTKLYLYFIWGFKIPSNILTIQCHNIYLTKIIIIISTRLNR